MKIGGSKMKRKPANKSLNRKGSQLKRDLKSLGRSGASFVPGLGLALSIRDTAKKTVKTVRTANGILWNWAKTLFGSDALLNK